VVLKVTDVGEATRNRSACLEFDGTESIRSKDPRAGAFISTASSTIYLLMGVHTRIPPHVYLLGTRFHRDLKLGEDGSLGCVCKTLWSSQ